MLVEILLFVLVYFIVGITSLFIVLCVSDHYLELTGLGILLWPFVVITVFWCVFEKHVFRKAVFYVREKLRGRA